MKTRYFEDGGGVGSGEGEGGFGGIGSADGGPSGLGGNVGGGQSAGGDTAAADGMAGIGLSGVNDGGFGGSGNDMTSGIYDLLGLGARQSMLSDNYTPQDNTQRQSYQPVYMPSYQDYNQGNPLAVSQYGQDYSSPFGQFVNPFSYSQQFYAPQANYMGGQGIGGLNPFGDYGMQFEGMTSPNYGIAGLYR
jgi:hypothetical protein